MYRVHTCLEKRSMLTYNSLFLFQSEDDTEKKKTIESCSSVHEKVCSPVHGYFSNTVM